MSQFNKKFVAMASSLPIKNRDSKGEGNALLKIRATCLRTKAGSWLFLQKN